MNFTDIIKKVKNVVSVVVNFVTGLGFHAIGLFIAGLILIVLYGGVLQLIGAGLIGAFVFDNFKKIVEYLKGIKL